MSLQRFLTAHTFVLFVCIPVWSQAFGTSVTGNAATSPCGTKTYHETGVRNSSGGASSFCRYAVANASSTADLDQGSVGHVIGNSTFYLAPVASASSRVMTFDTVTLIPPSTFNGDQVTFTMVDSYTTSVDNAHVTLCWTIPNLVSDCITTTTSTSQGRISKRVTLQKSTSGFHFKVTKRMAGHGVVNFPGPAFGASYATTGGPNFTLPTGWTCSFASDRLCQ
jgi:hypothetical protein